MSLLHYRYNLINQIYYNKNLTEVAHTGPLLGQVPRVPGTRKILSSYVMAPVNFHEIPGEQLPGTCKILTPLVSGTRGLMFLTRALGPYFWIKIAKNYSCNLPENPKF